jgi:transposase InsO family protein
MMGVLSWPRPGQNRRYANGFASIPARNTSRIGYPNHTHFIGQTPGAHPDRRDPPGVPRARRGTGDDLPPAAPARAQAGTKLKGPVKWTYFYLYVILDVFSRYAVGWTVQHREGAQLAKALIAQAAAPQKIPREQLTVQPTAAAR